MLCLSDVYLFVSISPLFFFFFFSFLQKSFTPLHCASSAGHKNVVEVLLAANANIHAEAKVRRILCVVFLDDVLLLCLVGIY